MFNKRYIVRTTCSGSNTVYLYYISFFSTSVYVRGERVYDCIDLSDFPPDQIWHEVTFYFILFYLFIYLFSGQRDTKKLKLMCSHFLKLYGLFVNPLQGRLRYWTINLALPFLGKGADAALEAPREDN